MADIIYMDPVYAVVVLTPFSNDIFPFLSCKQIIVYSSQFHCNLLPWVQVKCTSIGLGNDSARWIVHMPLSYLSVAYFSDASMCHSAALSSKDVQPHYVVPWFDGHDFMITSAEKAR